MAQEIEIKDHHYISTQDSAYVNGYNSIISPFNIKYRRDWLSPLNRRAAMMGEEDAKGDLQYS